MGIHGGMESRAKKMLGALLDISLLLYVYGKVHEDNVNNNNNNNNNNNSATIF